MKLAAVGLDALVTQQQQQQQQHAFPPRLTLALRLFCAHRSFRMTWSGTTLCKSDALKFQDDLVRDTFSSYAVVA